jgi:hypothetical protein
MKAGTLRVAAVTPVLLYVLARLVDQPLAWALGAAFAVGACLVSLLAVVTRDRQIWPFVPAAAVGIVALLGMLTEAGGASDLVQSLGAGCVLGSPWVLASGMVRWRGSLIGSSVFGTLAVLIGAFDLAVVRGLGVAAGVPTTAGAWWAASSVVVQSLVSGQSLGSPNLGPLAYLGDGVFDALTLVALFGLLLPLLLSSERLVGLPLETPPDASADDRERIPTTARLSAPAPPAPAFATDALPSSAHFGSGVASLVAVAAVLSFATWSSGLDSVPPQAGIAAFILVALVLLGWVGFRRPSRSPAARQLRVPLATGARRTAVAGTPRPTAAQD